jgi:hypothetical protein
MKSVGGSGSDTDEFDPLILGAAWDLTPKNRSSPGKRQLTLQHLTELHGVSGPECKKRRKDRFKTHKTYDVAQYHKKPLTAAPFVEGHAVEKLAQKVDADVQMAGAFHIDLTEV